MNTRFINQDSENSPENSGGDSKMAASASSFSSRRSKRGLQKRVVSVPLKAVDGLRVKGDQMSAPPSDSWAWRKYGQKPIKGSPYPRGYYRCSSSKGCPARKQVERSKLDPNMLLVTYSCDHNHPFPVSRNTHHTATTLAISASEEEEQDKKLPRHQEPPILVPDCNKFTNFGDGTEFGWFSDVESSTTCIMLESPIDRSISTTENEMAMIFTMREDDESLFADLGELPECSAVFRRGMAATT